MDEEIEHSAGPWRAYRTSHGKLLGVGDRFGAGITDSRGGLWGNDAEANVNADRIVVCVNLCDALGLTNDDIADLDIESVRAALKATPGAA